MRKRKEMYSAWNGVLELQIEVADVSTEEQAPHDPTKQAFLKALKQFGKEFEKAHPGYKVAFEGRGTDYYG